MAVDRNDTVRNFKDTIRAAGFSFRTRRSFGLRVINKSGSDIAAETLVAVIGYDSVSKLPEIILANNNTLGHYDVWVTKSIIHNGKQGDVFQGRQSAATLNTNGATIGDNVYLGTNGGFILTTSPGSPAIPAPVNTSVLVVGFVHVVSSTVGVIIWDIPASPIRSSSLQLPNSTLQTVSGTISSANITGTSTGQLGHANGFVLVAPVDAHTIIELESAVVALDFATAAYTGGGNTTINISGGGAALTGLVSAANLVISGADAAYQFVPLAAAANSHTLNKGLALVSAAAPTQPGTAAGVLNYVVNYRQHYLVD